MATPNPATTVAETVGQEPAAFPPFEAQNFAPQLVWLVITFVALYLLMSRIALPRVAGILQTRKARIAGDLAEAHDMRRKADEASAAHERTLAEARADAQASAQSARNAIATQAENQRKTLDDELNGKLAAAEQQIGATKRQAMGNVAAIATDAADAIVQHITGAPGDRAAIAAAVASG